ncbi:MULTISPECIES: polysaccharide biosynthesis protein [unclassified Paenibacillus]|uniref:polysaccharide biosynthesis protein n=1 Tax=unclassified Paenibacillus TaxID=185978 RepID=UPI00277F2476|nr:MULTISPECIES: polysaccharide biosynthesis protein [unclassified Paenibacillus]MDQ0901559.1 UDP-N-acetylglucosamine 4,6-dehydratase [Paenibacillus sp. V4I7]MDQ0919939.1 UDP-N-acetylglucosamine 4,6-dehydratase [Paenibacillus sp. V4I5]
MYNNKTIFITGGTGSWGYELVVQLLLQSPKKIIIYSRNESRQVAMQRIFNDPRLTFCIGDIRDKDALIKACKGADYIFHLAALKHVPVCEDQPNEALKTNILGTQIVIEAAIENQVKKVINVSTDKAVTPSNFYGMTKEIGEKLMIYANLLSPHTRFICVRGGNILGSNGSVIQIFKDQINKGGPVGITHKEMTRFFITLEEAIEQLLEASEKGQGGEIFAMLMTSCRIVELAQVIMEFYGKSNVDIQEIGIRPGEKLHESMLSEYERQTAVHYNERFLVILPAKDVLKVKQAYVSYEPVSTNVYCSSQNLMSKTDIERLLMKGGLLP